MKYIIYSKLSNEAIENSKLFKKLCECKINNFIAKNKRKGFKAIFLKTEVYSDNDYFCKDRKTLSIHFCLYKMPRICKKVKRV